MMVDDSNPSVETRIKVFSNIIYKHPVKAIIQTADYKIQGDVHVRPNHRLRDELNTAEQFLAVTNAVIFDRAGQVVHSVNFMVVNASHIIWLLPVDEIQDEK